jgi:hypothetical protein
MHQVAMVVMGAWVAAETYIPWCGWKPQPGVWPSQSANTLLGQPEARLCCHGSS